MPLVNPGAVKLKSTGGVPAKKPDSTQPAQPPAPMIQLKKVDPPPAKTV